MSKKIIDELMGEVDKKMCLDSPKEAEIYRKILRKSIQKSKKEVFDDLEKMEIDDLCELWIDEQYLKLKKRHLSTFDKSKAT